MTAHLLRGLAVAHRARPASPDERGRRPRRARRIIDWFAARADDAPDNLRHLQRLLEAERAWATDHFQTRAHRLRRRHPGGRARRRPWHRALILERAGKFYLAHGVRYAAQALLAEARHAYLSLGGHGQGRPAGLGVPGLPAPHPIARREARDDQPAARSRLATGDHRPASPSSTPPRR